MNPILIVGAVLGLILVLVFVGLKLAEKKGALKEQKEAADELAKRSKRQERVRAQPVPIGADLLRRVRARRERLRRSMQGNERGGGSGA